MKRRIVLADDHVMLRTGLCALLNVQPDLLVVGEASNGPAALDAVRKLQPEVAILDISMNGLNGIEVTRQILGEHLPTRVIILSMHATRRHIHQALQAGARGYVLKEAAAEELLDAIHTVLAGQRFFSPSVENELIEDYITRTSDEPESELGKLNEQERTILQLVVEGKSSQQIAEMLHLSPKTVDSYRSRLMQKLNIHDLPSLVKFALQQGLTTLK